jgi:hypothetical protein
MDERKRTFNTPIRERWNVPIHNILKAIDNHTALYLQTGLAWHEQKAAALRAYVAELKDWLIEQERQ